MLKIKKYELPLGFEDVLHCIIVYFSRVVGNINLVYFLSCYLGRWNNSGYCNFFLFFYWDLFMNVVIFIYWRWNIHWTNGGKLKLLKGN